MSTPFKVRPDAWARVSALLDEAYELDATARIAFIANIKASDAELGAEIDRFFSADATSGGADPVVAAQPGASGVPFATLLGEVLAREGEEGEPADATGSRFGAWTLTAKIGSGGMGEVWRAARSDGLFQGSAAIKLLRGDLPARRLAARFARERSVLARLNHPNIARLLDAGVANDQAFIVLELVEGESLLNYANAHAPTLERRVRLLRDVARAVEHAHSQLVLHRDLKPSNVMVTAAGTIKLLDFGIAAALDESSTEETAPNLTQLTGRGLTLEYAAPEQIVGESTVAASDVYSLGAMLFHLVTGHRVFAGTGNRTALEHAVVHTEAPRASTAVPPTEQSPDAIAPPTNAASTRGDLDAIIAKALRKSPSERYATATAFANDLDAWLARTPISILAEDRSYRARLWLRRNWKLATLAGVAVTAVFAGLGVSLWQRSEAIAAAALAKEEAARANKVADYLGELIGSASPDKHGGEWPSVLALLEKSEKDLATEFKDDPKTHAILLKRMLDTNDALNRDTVALAQSQRLQALLEVVQPPNVELQVDTLRQQGWLLYRLRRYEEALALYATLKPKLVAHYGEKSAEHAKLIIGIGGVLAEQGRYDEAVANYEQGYALLLQLEPNKTEHRLEQANDLTVLYTRQSRWQEAERALAAVESTFDTVSTTDGAAMRNVLIMRNNLEEIRLRIGRYDGAESRLQRIADAGSRLLGANNMISLKSTELLVSSACETGNSTLCLQRHQERLVSIKKRVGVEPSEVVEAELATLATALLFDQAPASASREALRGHIAAIATAIPKAISQRVYLYRLAADAAIRADDLPLASDALSRARRDLMDANLTAPDRVAPQVNRAEAAVAFRSGDPRRAVALLDARFQRDEKVKETDTPRHAALWLQRALYEIEFDRIAAMKSLAESRAAFTRAGGAMPQFKVLLTYVEARISGNTKAIRDSKEAVDRAYMRNGARAAEASWRVPHLTSL